MGTYYRIRVIEDDQARADGLQASLIEAMESVNQSMSNYIPDSELSRFNRLAAAESMPVSTAFAEVLQTSFEISELSAGAFDITLGPLIDAWGFGPKGRIDKQPTPDQLKQLQAKIGYQKIELNGKTLRKLFDGVEINLSAVAKGYAVDQVSETLLSKGFHNFLVDIGGELRAQGLNQQGKPWQLAIEKPNLFGGVQQVISLSDQAIATSGDYRNVIVVDGESYSHTIDPQSLSPVLHKLASVSVAHHSCAHADALATAILVMGEQRGLAFARENNLAVYMIVRGGSKAENDNPYSIQMTQEFAAFLQ